MKHTITEDVNVNLHVTVKHELPTEDLKQLVDKVADAAVMVIAAYTIARIVSK